MLCICHDRARFTDPALPALDRSAAARALVLLGDGATQHARVAQALLRLHAKAPAAAKLAAATNARLFECRDERVLGVLASNLDRRGGGKSDGKGGGVLRRASLYALAEIAAHMAPGAWMADGKETVLLSQRVVGALAGAGDTPWSTRRKNEGNWCGVEPADIAAQSRQMKAERDEGVAGGAGAAAAEEVSAKLPRAGCRRRSIASKSRHGRTVLPRLLPRLRSIPAVMNLD